MAIDLILQPFANSGDKTTPPQTDPNNFVNFTNGYTPDYEIDLSSGNPSAKAVERQVQNYMFYLLTSATQAWQQLSFAPWYSTMSVGGVAGYPKGAYVAVLTSGAYQIWRSLITNNTVNPLTTNQTAWEYVPLNTEILTQVAMPAGGVQETIPGGITNEVLTASTNFNTLTLGTWEFQTDALANGSANAPVPTGGGGTLAGMLEAKSWKGTGSNTFNAQRYIDRNGGMFIRGAQNGTWTSWAPVGLATTGVSAGSYGSSTQVATFTVNAFGQLSVAGNTAIAFPVTSFNTRTGAITLTGADVTTALGYSPVQSFNGRTGAVTLTQSDVTGALSAPANTLLGNATAATASPTFIGLANGLVMSGGVNLGLGAITPASVTTGGNVQTNGGQLIINSATPADRYVYAYTNGVARWRFGGTSDAESGSNAGTNWALTAFNDAGAFLSTPISIARATGVVTVAAGVASNGPVSVNTSAGNFVAMTLTNTGSNGAQIQMIGQGSTTPSKYLRVFSGAFQIINDANSAAILSLSDAGGLSVTGNISGTTLIANQNYQSSTSTAVLGTTGAGTVYLRPNGVASSTGQVQVDSSGNITTLGALSANGAIFTATGTEIDINWNFSNSYNNGWYISATISGMSMNYRTSTGAYAGSPLQLTSGGATINGNLTVTGTINFNTSDATLKKLDAPIEPQPFHRLPYYAYTRTDTGQKGWGPTAQDARELMPDYVQEYDHLIPGSKDTVRKLSMAGQQMTQDTAYWAARQVDLLWEEIRLLREQLKAKVN